MRENERQRIYIELVWVMWDRREGCCSMTVIKERRELMGSRDGRVVRKRMSMS